MSGASKIIRASKKNPCPVCGGDHKCGRTADGLILCGRSTGDVPGFACHGPAKDPTWTLYKADGEPSGVSRRVSRGGDSPDAVRSSARQPFGTPFALAMLARKFTRDLTPPRKQELAAHLKLPAAGLDALPDLGWDDASAAWTVPEVDADGQVVGISTRRRDGSKRCVAGSRRGLVATAGWADGDGPIFVVEGMSDAAALAAVGLAAVARPGASAGGEMLADLFRRWPSDRPIFVLAENDRKPDGRWPGKDGADHVAGILSAALPDRAVYKAAPPDAFKDARAWVVGRLTPTADPVTVGRDIALAVGQAAKIVKLQPADLARRWPAPVGITAIAAEVDADPNPTGWLWDGYLPRNGLAILSALPKCGKTTLLTHLLAAVTAGGEFLGRTVLPGRAVVITEEDKGVWAERQKRHALSDAVGLVIRPFVCRPSLDDWASFLSSLTADLDADARDLVILDTLADLWPVRDENHATDVTDALKPLRKLAAAGRAVLCVHHVRKSGGENGVASRGSGAIAGFFDVMMELGYAAGDPDGRRRKLTAKGRLDGIPGESLIEMAKDGRGYRVVDERAAKEDRVKQREATEDERRVALREALCLVIPFGTDDDALTRDQIWAKLPDAVRVNAKRFEAVLEEGCGDLWVRKGNVGREGYRYWRVRSWGVAGDGN